HPGGLLVEGATPAAADDLGDHGDLARPDDPRRLLHAAAHRRVAVREHLMSAPALNAPKTARSGGRTNYEMWSWIFMRVSGIVLVFLVLGHLLIMNVLDGGVQRINFAFVAGRWSSPFWQVWDLLQLWLAMIHGANGLRTIINDYSERDQT